MNFFKKKYFFGWENIKWFIMEMGNIMANKPSYFSQKRIQQLVAFIVLQWGCVSWLIWKHVKMDTMDFVIWASVECSIIGYSIYQVQKEKIKPVSPEK